MFRRMFGRRSARWLMVAGLVVVMVAAGLAPAIAQDGADGPRGKIVFRSVINDSDRGDIFVMNADGTGRRALTSGPADDWLPVWSPDGTRIAFTSNLHGNNEIYIMDEDGGNLTRVTNNPASDRAASWSPDGTQLIFQSDRSGDWEVYRINIDGTGETRLTFMSGPDYVPMWSPDGTRFATYSNHGANSEVVVWQADGSDFVNATQDPGHDSKAAWSPDSQRLAWSSGRNGNSEIYIMDADGGNIEQVTNDPARDFLEHWSTDGRYLLIASDRADTTPDSSILASNLDIYLYDLETGEMMRLTDHEGLDHNATMWVPPDDGAEPMDTGEDVPGLQQGAGNSGGVSGVSGADE